MKRVLFVCTGNICRSPTAEGVARHLVAQHGLPIEVDSAGTQGYHVGEPPDPRAQRVARKRGYDLSKLRARKLIAADFGLFDLLLAMDRGHLQQMQRMCPPEFADRVHLFLDYLPGPKTEVPDPYYGGEAGFEHVLDLCEDGVNALFAALRKQGM
ncbi:low molecular weight protein-tyrosine-phosphatase [Niveibacterium umoris]|uniref:protein-tyrosine-phosphatase n=1 Tax=Niveibacterium umoris TaxID=1193620 RepID=A0A840BGX9_9RHOO|nr:low molecular weight protein-tyrosine-phosphatase [Niveibacterium umoris]MBB4010879.1 protein-tyrosine phosphatase [Niveibacterium umoris]